MDEVSYETSPTLRKLVKRLISVSSPKVRQFTSEVSAYFDGVFSKIFNVLPESSPGEKSYMQTEDLPTVRINGEEFPYLRLADLTKGLLRRSGLFYKDHWEYKFWHAPNEQFSLLRRANRLVNGAFVEPVAVVLNTDNAPTGYVMRLARGSSLLDVLNSGSLSNADVDRFDDKLSERIRYMHSAGIGHGDLNLDNIFLRSGFDIDLIDPLETVSAYEAMSLDFAWLGYIRSQLSEYKNGKRRSSFKQRLFELIFT